MFRYPDAPRCHPAESFFIGLAERIRIEQRVWDNSVGGCLARHLSEMTQQEQEALTNRPPARIHHPARMTEAVVVAGGLLIRRLLQHDQLVPLDDHRALAVSAERAFVENQPLLALRIRVHVAADDGIPLRFGRPDRNWNRAAGQPSLPAAISGLIAGSAAGIAEHAQYRAELQIDAQQCLWAVATHRVELVFNLVQPIGLLLEPFVHTADVRRHLDRRVPRRSRKFPHLGELTFATNQESCGTQRRGERTGEEADHASHRTSLTYRSKSLMDFIDRPPAIVGAPRPGCGQFHAAAPVWVDRHAYDRGAQAV